MGLESSLVIVSHLAYAHYSIISFSQSNSTSSSCISSTSCGVGGWLAIGLVIPIIWESLSLRSVVVPRVSIPIWAIARDLPTTEEFVSVMCGETVPVCSPKVGVCQTSSSPSACSSALA